MLIDGLKGSEQRQVRRNLAQAGLWKLKKLEVRGIRDESSSLVRCADAVAGVVREAVERKAGYPELVERLKRLEVLTEL